jgi:signal peptidase I
MLVIYLALHIYFIADAYLIALKTGDRISKLYNRWLIYIIIFAVNLFLAGPFKDYINSDWMTAHKVPTASMQPTLHAGDYFIGDYTYYVHHEVKPGDVVIIKYPENPEIKYIERCIALGGQVIEIRNKAVYVDSSIFRDSSNTQYIDQQVHAEEYNDPEIYPAFAGNRDNYGPVTVPENHCFVLGDNRDNSSDSRYWGFVPMESVVAKPLYIYWSGDTDRIGKTIE